MTDDELDARLKELKDLMGGYFDRWDAKLDRCLAILGPESQPLAPVLPDGDPSRALAKAIRRVAELQSRVHRKRADLPFAEEGVREGFWSRDRVARTEAQLAALEADLDAAERELAVQLAAWRMRP